MRKGCLRPRPSASLPAVLNLAMRWTDLVPTFLKPFLRPIWKTGQTTPWLHPSRFRPVSREELNRYWRENSNGDSIQLVRSAPRSAFIKDLIDKHARANPSILEIGCDGGGNLDFLYRAGLTRLAGVEISPEALRLLRENYPEMASRIRLVEGPIEDQIKQIADGEFDVVFTISVLAYIHHDCDWVLAEMVRVTSDLLISIDQKRAYSSHAVARDYRRIFERLGMEMIDQPSLGGLAGADEFYFSAFVFRKPPARNPANRP